MVVRAGGRRGAGAPPSEASLGEPISKPRLAGPTARCTATARRLYETIPSRHSSMHAGSRRRLNGGDDRNRQKHSNDAREIAATYCFVTASRPRGSDG